MKLFKNLRIYLILLVIIAIAVLLILNDFLAYGLILAGIAFFIFWAWQLFLKNKEDEISKLTSRLDKTERQNRALQAENEELRSRKLNISEIRNILDLGLMEINTNFTRTWNDKFDHGKKSVHFIGALKVKIIAKYGIDMREFRFKYDRDTNILSIANINPRFLSFNDLDYEWKIAEILEYKKPWLGIKHWRKSEELKELEGQIKENLRLKVHQEVINGTEELEWVIEPLKKQIANTLELLFSAPGRTIQVVDRFDDTFKTLEEYTEKDNETID